MHRVDEKGAKPMRHYSKTSSLRILYFLDNEIQCAKFVLNCYKIN